MHQSEGLCKNPLIGLGVGGWWSLHQPAPPPLAGSVPAGTVCPPGTHLVWSRQEGRQCVTMEELRAAAHEESQPLRPRQLITLGPGVVCQDQPLGITCTCTGR